MLIGFTPLLGYKNCFGIDEIAEVADLILGQGSDISQTLDVRASSFLLILSP
jgi:hypothetical protein